MNNIQKNFNNYLALYEEKSPFLPPRISWKINLLINLIRGKQPQKQILSLEQRMQYQNLRNLDNQGLKLVFNSILQTLFTKTFSQSSKCQIKKKGILHSWITATIHNDQTNFIISYQNKTCIYKMDQCQIKKSKQSRRAFQLYELDSHKYSLRFSNQQQMVRMLHLWQREIIEAKTKRNFQTMKTAMFETSPDTQMMRLSLFQVPLRKNAAEKNNFFIKLIPSFQMSCILTNATKDSSIDVKFQRSVPKLSSRSPQTNKKIKLEKISNLKPVPHEYVSKFSNKKVSIALTRGQNAKIYIQYIFGEQVQLKHITSLLLLQKSWNNHVAYETIEKPSDLPNQIQICRKYDTFKEVGQFVQINSKVTYTSCGSNMSIITAQSIQSINESNSVYSKLTITLQSQKSQLRVLIEEQLKSDKYDTEKLRTILFGMYKQIIKLDLIQDKIVVKDLQAKMIINSILQDEYSTITESQEQIQDKYCQKTVQLPHNMNDNEDIKYTKNKASDQEKTYNRKQRYSQQLIDSSVSRLKSPLQLPNYKYIKQIKMNQFQRNYFKFQFPQQILAKHDDYVPSYRLDKMICSKFYEVIPSRQLRFIDQQLLDSQKQTLGFILRQMGANLISGKSVLNVSLPVDIFQSRTGLQRSAASYGCSPGFLIPRAYSPPIQQMKYVAGFVINTICPQLVMQKPFNPILGQTFQGYIKGIPIYYEQISHSPPISSYFMKCPQFTLYGNLVPYVDVGLNTGTGGNLGPMHIVFPNGSHFQCYFPPSEVAGLIYGQRKFRCYNKGYILEQNNQLYCEFSMQNQKKGVYQTSNKLKVGQLIGGIYKIKPQFFTCIDKFKAQHKTLKKFGGLTKQFIVQKYHTISGQWFSDILIDGQVINKGVNLYPVEYAKNLLPSDSNHRLDVLYHKIKDLTNSQIEKQNLQVIQRNDKKQREKYLSSYH